MGWGDTTKADSKNEVEDFVLKNSLPSFGKVEESTSWLEDSKETIVIFGEPKIGKTFSYLGVIEDEIAKNSEVKFYIINTDGGLARSFKEYFGSSAQALQKNIAYYFASNIKDAIAALQEITPKVKSTDWIIMDLMSDFWDMAQEEFVREVSGGNVTDYIMKASKDASKFGLFDSNKWSYVKYLDNCMTMVLPTRPICNIIGVCAEKDLEIEAIKNAGKGGTEMTKLYKELMARPAGQKQIAYKFNTILYISGSATKQVTIFGDRGKLKVGTKFTYDKNMWKAFKEERVKIAEKR